MFTQDFILNGHAHGPVAQIVGNTRFDPGMYRPYFTYLTDRLGNQRIERCVTVNSGRYKWDAKLGCEVPIYAQVRISDLESRGIHSPVFNATSLRKEEWLQLDTVVKRAARYRLNFTADLGKSSTYGGFNGMAKLILEHEVMSDPGEAIVSMNGITPGRRDSPKFQLRGLPLPIIHSDFDFDARRLAASRNSAGTALDVVQGEAGGRRIGEALEKLCIGNQTGPIYGGNSTQVGGYDLTSQTFGLLNYTNRLTKTNAYKPTLNGRAGTGWVPADTLKDVLAALDQLRLNKFYGPFTIYHSNDWDQYLDNDYILTGGNVATQTLRERLKAIEGITDVKRLDFLFASLPSSSTGPGAENVTQAYPFVMIFAQLTPDVIRLVNGMDITTLQWQEKGGMQNCFKIMTIQTPQVFSDFYGNCGILQVTANN